MKDFFKKFKEFRKDPKKKSISLLIIYGIFFIFVFIYIRSGTPNPQVNNSNQNINITQNQNEITSYEYEYEINKDNNIIKITGTFINNEDVFNVEPDKYLINNYYIYSNEERIIEFPINKLGYNEINKYVSNIDYNAKTEYKDGQIKYEYIISNKDFSNYFQEENNIEGNVYITVNKKDYIDKIEIDLKEYYNTENYKINIEYTNINNISNIENKN